MAPSTFVLDEHEEEHLQPATDSPGPAPIASATPRPLHIVQLVQQTSPTLQPCDPVQLISAAVVQHGEAHEGHAFPGAPTSLAEAVQQAQVRPPCVWLCVRAAPYLAELFMFTSVV